MGHTMNNKIFFIIVLILFTTIANAQPEWYVQNSGTNSFLFDVHFVDENTGWVCGHLSTILYTSDGGDNWTDLNPPPSNDYNGIYFVNQTEGWVLGYNGIIRHTTDGGVSWNTQSTPTQHNKSDLYFVDANTGWTVGGKPRTFTDPIREILHTTDGGNNWTLQYNSNNEDPLGAVYFLNENCGWAVGSMSAIMKTTDGGNNWITQMSGNGYQFEDVHFVNPDTGWVVGEDLSVQHYAVIFKTVDGGINWDIQTFGSDDAFAEIQFVNDSTGWVVGGNNTAAIILYTSDGGTNWISQTPNTTNLLSAVSFVDENNGWAVGFDGTIIHTDNTVPVELDKSSPAGFSLKQNYPNPFNPSTTIEYSIPEGGNVRLVVYNSLGEEVAVMKNNFEESGSYKINFDASNLSSGIYYYQLNSGEFSSIKKMIILK
jgi:photosystem II stability/assembly factor-like uncharacterized protein